MTDDEKERERMAWVFGLTGGEMNDKPWIAGEPEVKTGFDCVALCDAGERVDLHRWAYWYDGLPHYVQSEYPDRFERTYITVLDYQMFGEPPEVLVNASGTWRRINWWASSGETECPCNDAESCGEEPPIPCPLCGRDDPDDEDTSYISIGDGWAEVSYRLDSFTYHVNLNERGLYHADVRNSAGETVYEIKVGYGEDEDTHDNPAEDYVDDLDDLRDHLIELGIMTDAQTLEEAD